jgi:hypothetical protein
MGCENLQRQNSHPPAPSHSSAEARRGGRSNKIKPPLRGHQGENFMKTIAFAALAVLGLVLGTANLVSPAHAATYYFAMSHSNNGNGGGGSN